MSQPYCYKITLPTTDSLKFETYMRVTVGGKDFDTEFGGIIYYIASSLLEVATRFPDAIWVERIGRALDKEAVE